MERIADRLSTDDDGKRIVICRPPPYTGLHNPNTRISNEEQGILSQGKAVLVPRVFASPAAVRAAADSVLSGRTLHLAQDFDGAAWCLLEMAADVLAQLAKDKNLLTLPSGELRVLQLIFDGHGFISRCGAVRFLVRSPHTIRDHNIRRNARDPIFFMGEDKHHHLEKAIEIGGDHSMKSHFYNGLHVSVRKPSEMPLHVQADKDYLPFACVKCEIILNVPGAGHCRLTQSGDCAAAHAAFAINSPVNRRGACLYCTAPKKDWINAEVIEKERTRNFVYQVYANHRVLPEQALRKVVDELRMQGEDELADKYEDHELLCPHCGIVVNEELVQKEAQELLEASPQRVKELLNLHSASHACGMRGRLPIAPMDQDQRSRGLLHRRMNAVSNALAATFLRLPFNEKQRLEANALLATHRMLWRFPETSKKRAKTISAGNDARNILSNEPLLTGLFKIFYGEEATKHMASLDALGAAAAANTGVRNENPVAGSGAVAGRGAVVGNGAVAGAVASRVVTKLSKKRAKPMSSICRGGKAKVTATPAVYARKRTSTKRKPTASVAGSSVAHAAASPPSDEEEDDVDQQDRSCVLEDELMEEAELDEDDESGNLQTAIAVWHTVIQYMADLHATYTDHFDLTLRNAHAEKCANSGQAWAHALNAHTNNRALWQYPHDTFHVKKDIGGNGTGDLYV